MATYIPNAIQIAEPVESRTVESAALEFRTLKTSINERLDAETDARAAGDDNLQTQAAVQDERIKAIEAALFAFGDGSGMPGTVYVQRLSGTGAQTAFTLNVSVPTSALIDIFINGVYQNKDTFTISGTSLTFSEAPLAGTGNIEVVISITVANVETDASLVSFRATDSTAVVRTAQDKMLEWVSVKDFGAVGDGVTDDTAAIQAALDLGGGPVRLPLFGKYRITSQLVMPDGAVLYSEAGTPNIFLSTDDTLRIEGGAALYVDFGAGITSASLSTYYANAAVQVGSGCRVSGVSVWYPNQDIGAATPTAAYPPAFAIAAGVRSVVLENINLGNAYIGIDVGRDNHGVVLRNIAGFPLYRGIIHGSAINPIQVDGVDFSGLRTLYGSPWISPNIASWVMSNGMAVELRRTTWANYENIFAYGYSVGVLLTNGPADASNGITIGGSPQNITIRGCGFDTCPIGIKGDGFQGRVVIDGCNFAPRVEYSLSPAVMRGISMVCTAGGTVTDVAITNCRFWSVMEDCIYLERQDGSRIHGCHIEEIGNARSGVGIELVNTKNAVVSGNFVSGNSYTNTNRGITLTGDCQGAVVSGNVVRDFDSNPILLDATDRTQVVNNVGENNTLALVADTSASKKYGNVIRDNIDNIEPTYTNSHVNASGLLSFAIGQSLLSYSGTAGIKGITHGSVGAMVTIRFAAACTVTDEDAGTAQENRLYLAGNFVTDFGDTLTLVSRGSLGWYEVSRSAN